MLDDKKNIIGSVHYDEQYGWWWSLGKNMRFCSLWIEKEAIYYDTPGQAKIAAIDVHIKKEKEKELASVESEKVAWQAAGWKTGGTRIQARPRKDGDWDVRTWNENTQKWGDSDICDAAYWRAEGMIIVEKKPPSISMTYTTLTKAQETACSLVLDQQYFLESIYKGWDVNLDMELLESLQIFECLDEKLNITEFGIEVAKELANGIGK